MMENLVWRAYYHSMSGHEIRPFNIFEHGRFREEVRKLLLKCTEKEAFAEELRRSLFYYYCSKCEWEVVIGPWCGNRGRRYERNEARYILQLPKNYDTISIDFGIDKNEMKRLVIALAELDLTIDEWLCFKMKELILADRLSKENRGEE